MAVIDVVIESEEWEQCSGLEARIVAAAEAALHAAGISTLPAGEIAVLLTDDEGIAALNMRWRGKSSPTNVLSWPSVAPKLLPLAPMIGDIALAYETCAREAAAEGKRFEDHIMHLTVHGTLHLLGFDHEGEAEAEAMEEMERRTLAALGVPDPYAALPQVGETGA